MKKIHCVSILFALLCFKAYTQPTDLPTNHLVNPEYEGIIMAENRPAYTIPANAKRFTPTKAEIELLEEKLTKNIKKINKKHPNQFQKSSYIERRLKKYKRQYFGYFTKEGKRAIYVNMFMGFPLEKGLKEEFIFLDGGSDYWHISFLISTASFFDFSVNGVA